jgi:hypothetical protein
MAAYDELAKASSKTICVRFGSWEEALRRAGLADRYIGSPLAPPKFSFSVDEMVAELQRVSKILDGKPLKREIFDEHAAMNSNTVRLRFGSWCSALRKAGLEIPRIGIRYSADEYFENLLSVWTHFGCQPSYGEMKRPPSKISARAYEKKWGTWRKALLAFLEKVSSDTDDAEPDSPASVEDAKPGPRKRRQIGRVKRLKAEDQHQIRLGLRYQVLKRAHFRCVLCGRSPATHVGCVLHVDHIVPFSKDGKTVLENLRSACENCNLGKGATLEV